MENKELIINNYIQAYNDFDVEGMLKDMHDTLSFENISNGKSTLNLEGKTQFKAQAEKALTYFSKRKQTIEQCVHHTDRSEVDIHFYAILANNMPNGMRKGDVINLKGKSTFNFNEQNQIVKITDIS